MTGNVLPPADLGAVEDIWTTYGTVVARLSDGSLKAWGENDPSSIIPTNVGDVVDLTGTGGCSNRILALRTDGTLIAWGNGCYSEPNPLPTDIKLIASGSQGAFHVVAKTDDSIQAWGYSSGVNGAPASVLGVRSISKAQDYVVAALDDGSLKAWGWGRNPPPSDATPARKLAAGQYHVISLKENGTLFSWGERYTCPTGTFVDVSTLRDTSVALRADGTLAVWGYEAENLTAPLGYRFTKAAVGLNLTTYKPFIVAITIPVDTDGDGIADSVDNCVAIANPNQADCNGDGVGDACQIASGALADVNGNNVPDGCESQSWATVLEYAPNPAVVTDANLRAAISAAGLPWRVVDNGTGIEMLLVPGGTFMMGCSPEDTECLSDESPTHQVTLTNAFYIGKTEVTQAQWTAKMGSNPSYFVAANGYPGSFDRPVESVSWNMIAGTAGFMPLTGFRLPTEAEWEYACRAWTTTARYGPIDDIAWYGSNSENQSHAVAGKLANALGLYDMICNVWEWNQDSNRTYAADGVTDPTGPVGELSRAFRGGGWDHGAAIARASQRWEGGLDWGQSNVGFRVAKSAVVMDSDGDGFDDATDLCPTLAGPCNGCPTNICGGCGAALDTDNDGTPNCMDDDDDNDGVVDSMDAFPLDASESVDTDHDGIGNNVDTDDDGDGFDDATDLCPLDPNKSAPGQCGCGVADTDSDGDGVADCIDNCVALANPTQDDCNGNGIGDACESAAATAITAKLWGAAGGPNRCCDGDWSCYCGGTINCGATGPSGGYLSVELESLAQGTTLYIYVGQGGEFNGLSNTFGGGGRAVVTGGGSGGGASYISLVPNPTESEVAMLIAVAGGAGGGPVGNPDVLGNGGGLAGANGSTSGAGGVAATGGTQTAGGTSATGGYGGGGAAGSDGQFLQGGYGMGCSGGGGGGGFYGGGGGHGDCGDCSGGIGGGGSSFVNHLRCAATLHNDQGIGNFVHPDGQADSDWANSAGNGTNGSGNHGRVVLVIGGDTYAFSYTGAVQTFVVPGFVADCNSNGIPDSCETDTDADGIIDACDACPDVAGLPSCNGCPTNACGDCGAELDTDGDGTPDCNDRCPLLPGDPACGGCPADVCSTNSAQNWATNDLNFDCGSSSLNAFYQPNSHQLAASDVTVTVSMWTGYYDSFSGSLKDTYGNTILSFNTPDAWWDNWCGSQFSQSFTISAATFNQLIETNSLQVTGSLYDPYGYCRYCNPRVQVSFSYGSVGLPTAGSDTDGDGVPIEQDLCPTLAGPCNGCPTNACGGCGAELDTDGDGTPDCVDNDDDNDGVVDSMDAFPLDANESVDTDHDGIGNNVDMDDDGDGFDDATDLCPLDPNKSAPGQCGCGVPDTDTDGDGVADCVDNCPNIANPNQADCNGDGVGDACETIIDCNANDIPDSCDIASGFAQDCNANGIPDSCDIANGAIDINADSIPDACQGLTQHDTTTGSLGSPTANVAVSTTFTGITGTVTDAVLIIRAKGDFDAGFAGYEFLTVKLNNVTYSRVFGTGAVNCSSAVNGGVNTAVITIPIAQFAAYAATGTLKVTLLPAPSVTASECPDGFMTVELKFISLNASGDCDSNSLWDLGEIQANLALDHNNNSQLDTCEIRNNPALDRNNNGVLDSWDISQDASLDRNNNGVLDSWEISQDASLDRNNNGMLDSWEISQDASLDRNNNGVLDSWDISQDASLDRNNNGVLDSWDISQDASLDRNNNGMLDSWEISQDASLDRNNNGMLDSWDISQDASLDRNNNGVLDSWDISQDASLDRNNNGVLDSYDVIADPSLDCNSNGSIDQYEIVDNAGLDCDANGRLDSCDIAINNNASVLAWGHNPYGQCNIPADAQAGVTAIAGGYVHTIVLKNGAVLAWGPNWSGECNIPAAAQSGVSAITSGSAHSTIALKNGAVLAWGYNGYGECTIPAAATSGVTAIASGWYYNIALKDGAVLAWGRNEQGQCSIPTAANTGVTAIACGGNHTIALKDGAVLAWGDNDQGQCIIPAEAQSGVAAIAGGGWHTIALKDGAVLAWGWNADGQCTIPVAAQSGVTAIAGGSNHTLALKNGAVLAWGDNSQGQCAIPTAANSGITAIASGSSHTLALHTPADTNNDGRLDSCEIADNAALDRNNNHMLDSYDCAQNPALDCNINSQIDQYEIIDNELLDCDFNSKIDSCDIASGAADDDIDSHLDSCEFSKGDLDLSGIVDSGDFSILLLYYGEIDPVFGDFDSSGIIDSGDASIMLLYFGEVTWP